MAKRLPPEIKAHLHNSNEVTLDRLDQFADAPRHVQVRVLAQLRERTVENSVELALTAVIFAILMPLVTAMFVPEPVVGDLLVKVIVASAIGLFFTVVFGLMIGWGPISRQITRTNAIVWLGAFEAELDRRRGQPGRRARMWRAHH